MKAANNQIAGTLLLALWAAITLSHIWLWNDLTSYPERCDLGCWWQLNLLIGGAIICVIYVALSVLAWRRLRRDASLRVLVWTLASYVVLFVAIYRPLVFSIEGLDAW